MGVIGRGDMGAGIVGGITAGFADRSISHALQEKRGTYVAIAPMQVNLASAPQSPSGTAPGQGLVLVQGGL